MALRWATSQTLCRSLVTANATRAAFVRHSSAFSNMNNSYVDFNEIASVHDLPPLPSLKQFAEEAERMKAKANTRRLTEQEEEELRKDPRYAIPKSVIAHEVLREVPLPAEPRTDNVAILQVERLTAMFLAQLGHKKEESFRIFIKCRKEGFIPSLEMYSHLFPILVLWQAWEGYDMLLKEYNQLKYPITVPLAIAELHRAIIRTDIPGSLRVWERIDSENLDIPEDVYAHQFLLLSRYGGTHDQVLQWYQVMKSRGKLDRPDTGSLILSYCVQNGAVQFGKQVYEDMQKTRALVLDLKKDGIPDTRNHGTVYLLPKQRALVEFYESMAQLACVANNPPDVDKFLALATKINRTVVQHGAHYHAENFISPATCSALIRMYCNRNDPSAVLNKRRTTHLQVLDTMISRKVNPPLHIFEEVFHAFVLGGHTSHYLKVMAEFELIGHTPSAETLNDSVILWSNAGDDRRVINTWNYSLLMHHGHPADAKTRELMMLAYHRSGYTRDALTFYDRMLNAGHELTPQTHVYAIREYLNHQYPTSARYVAQRLAQSGHPPSQAVIEEIAHCYGSLGGGRQLARMIEKDMLGPGAKFSLTAPILAAAIEGFSKPNKVPDHPSLETEDETLYENVEGARALWDRFKTQVSLDARSTLSFIKSFTSMHDGLAVEDVFDRFDSTYQYKDEDSKAYEATLLSYLRAPLGKATFLDKTKVLDRLKAAKLLPTMPFYSALLRLCITFSSPESAIKLVKDFAETFYPVAVPRYFATDFFTVIARFDQGHYRREALLWMNRLNPQRQGNSFFFQDPRGVTPLTEFLEEELPLTLSMQVLKYIMDMDVTKLKIGERAEYNELFHGGPSEIEDILIHERGHSPSEVYQALEADSDYHNFERLLHSLSDARLGKSSIQSQQPQIEPAEEE